MIEALADLQYKVLDRMRHRDAFEVAGREGSASDFEALRGARQCLVVSFKRSGEAVPTPVNFGLSDDGRLYFRSEPRSAKVRRIRRDSHVRVCACNMRGKPTGPMVEGAARVLPDDAAESVLASNWSPPMRVLERGLDRLPVQMVYVEVTPAGSPLARTAA
jgi:PPOX class probable F420-dependent enzyme